MDDGAEILPLELLVAALEYLVAGRGERNVAAHALHAAAELGREALGALGGGVSVRVVGEEQVVALAIVVVMVVVVVVLVASASKQHTNLLG